MERSISENKNNHRPERSSLSDERLMGLRQMKEHARERTGGENVNTLDKRIMKKMKVVHSNYINRKEKEEPEKLLSELRKRDKLEKTEKCERKQSNK